MRHGLLLFSIFAVVCGPCWAQAPYLTAPAASDAICAQRCAEDRFCHSWRRTQDGSCSLSLSAARPERPAPSPRIDPPAMTQLRGLSGQIAPPAALEPAEELLGGPETETQS